MYLRSMASRWLNESFDGYDQGAGAFVAGSLRGRLGIADNSPSVSGEVLRRRTLHYPVDASLPDSRTIRHPASGDVYLVGQTRSNTDRNQTYDKAAICHLVDDGNQDGSSGVATIRRRGPTGPSEDPGWLVENVAGKYYSNLVYSTSQSEPDLKQHNVETFFMYLPLTANAAKYDFVELQGNIYRIADLHFDSGFLVAGLDKEEDYRVDLVVEVSDSRTYDESLSRYVDSKKDFNVTMLLDSHQDFNAWNSESSDYMSLSVDVDHIGFRPKAGMVIKYEGRSRTIHHVQFHRGERQYQIRCR